jgi:hypothetical protein
MITLSTLLNLRIDGNLLLVNNDLMLQSRIHAKIPPDAYHNSGEHWNLNSLNVFHDRDST